MTDTEVNRRLQSIEGKIDSLNKRLFIDPDSLMCEVGKNKSRIDLVKLRMSIPAMVLGFVATLTSVASIIYTVLK